MLYATSALRAAADCTSLPISHIPVSNRNGIRPAAPRITAGAGICGFISSGRNVPMFANSVLGLPMLGAALTFRYSFKVGRHPATIETAGLRKCAVVANAALLHQIWVKGQISGNRRKLVYWFVITPCGQFHGRGASTYVEVPCNPLPLTKAPSRRRDQGGGDIFGWEVVGRCVVSFEDTHCSGGVGDDFASETHANALFHALQRGRARV